jgi:pyruvate dehydrogenase E2 component (dihydrolipoamide acetyltransferase)
MAQNMELAHAEVASVTLMDDANIEAWPPGTPTLMRLIRALVSGCRAEPSLNAWYDSEKIGRWVLKKIDIGIAVDTPDGLLVPVLRNCGERDAQDLKQALDKLIADARARKVPPEELRANTITLSNYGSIAGRYASPVVVPPTVAIPARAGSPNRSWWWTTNQRCNACCRCRSPSSSGGDRGEAGDS